MFEKYLNIFIAEHEYFYSFLFLTLARVLPIITMAPFFGAKLMPGPARVGFAICLFAILLPLIVSKTNPIPWSPIVIVYGLKEMAIGFLLGFLVTVPFYIVQMAGIVIDNQRGSSSLLGQDATTASQVSSIGILYNYLMIVIFFSINGPFIFLDALVKSYRVLPQDVFLSNDFFLNGSSQFWIAIMGLAGQTFTISSQLAAPALLTILMTDAFLGVINRLAPQVQISFLGQGLKAFLGDFAIWLAWFFLLEKMGTMGLKWLVTLSDIVTQLGPK